MSVLVRPGLLRELFAVSGGAALGYVAAEVLATTLENRKIKKTVRGIEDELQQRVAEDHLRRAAAEQHGGGDGQDGIDGPSAVA